MKAGKYPAIVSGFGSNERLSPRPFLFHRREKEMVEQANRSHRNEKLLGQGQYFSWRLLFTRHSPSSFSSREARPMTQHNAFATALNCMDGRVQLCVNEAVRATFGVSFVDTITEAGIVRFLSDETDGPETAAALSSIRISVAKHGSCALAVVAHHDCAGNRRSDETQREQLIRAVDFLKEHFPACKIVGLWVDGDWVARVVVSHSPG